MTQRRTPILRLLAPLALAATIATQPTTAATASSTVGVHIPGSTSITNQCTSQLATDFGSVLADSRNLTTTGANVCRFQFGSSNDTATARLAQRDHTGTAMASLDAGTWQAVNEPTSEYRTTSMVDGVTAFAGGDTGVIRRTTDDGANWSIETSNMTSPVTAIAAIDADNAYAVGGSIVGSPEISTRTTAGGATWTSRTPPAGISGPIFDVAFDPATPSTAIAASLDGHIIRTTDSGATWTTVHWGGVLLTSVTIDGTLAFASGLSDQLLRSTDGGVTWGVVATGLPAATFVPTVQFGPGPTLWIGYQGGVMRSVDPAAGAPTFSTVLSFLSICHGVSISAPDATTVFISSTCGRVYRSTDANAGTPTFVTIDPPPLGLVLSIDAISSSDARAATDGTLLRTSDGSNWTVDESDRDAIDAIDAWDADNVMVAAGYGYAYVSDDGGGSWTTRTTGSAQHLRSVDMSGPDEAWAAGSAGSVFHTADDGATWTELPTGVATNLADVALMRDGSLVAVGTGGTIRRSVDDGATWSAVTSGTVSDLRSIDVDEQTGRAWIATNGNGVLTSTDEGRTWTQQALPGASSLLQVAAAGADSAWAIGSAGYWKTTNGGASWSGPLPTHIPTTIDAIDSSNAIIGEGFLSDMHRTSDGGATWADSGDLTAFTNPVVTMIDAATAFVAWGNGTVYRQSPAATIPDYAGGAWASAPSAFGVCLQAIGANTAATWTVDAGGTPGLCEASDADNWYAVPTAPTAVASTTSVGATGSIDLVWGLRAGAAQEPKQYVATVDVEVVAATP